MYIFFLVTASFFTSFFIIMNFIIRLIIRLIIWGEWWGSNPRQPEPQSGALPTELHPPCQINVSIRFLG